MQNSQIESVLIALRRLIRATDLHSRDLARTTGLTTPQLLLLQSIKQNGEITIGQLANQVNLSQATVTSILDRLENKGCITRKRSEEDRRKVHAYLTSTGAQLIEKAPAPLQEHFIRQFDGLQEWEKSMILASLQRVASMMDAEDIDAAPVLDVGTLDRQAATQDKSQKPL